MTSPVDHDDVDQRVSELNLQPRGNPRSKQTAADDVRELPASSSSSSALQFQADWSRFATVYAKGT